jgi:hypothetical protein
VWGRAFQKVYRSLGPAEAALTARHRSPGPDGPLVAMAQKMLSTAPSTLSPVLASLLMPLARSFQADARPAGVTLPSAAFQFCVKP